MGPGTMGYNTLYITVHTVLGSGPGPGPDPLCPFRLVQFLPPVPFLFPCSVNVPLNASTGSGRN